MHRFFQQLERLWAIVGAWLLSNRGQTITVAWLLMAQVALLAYSATRHSPTQLEPAFLASGISHWRFGRFELYRVNPPLVRMVAALPAIFCGCKTDWSEFVESPGARCEFPIGSAFIEANGSEAIRLFVYARWACIPFSVIGAFFAYRWARELYGGCAGLVTLILYIFDPNLLAHGELITPDAACTALGIMACYFYWKWLCLPGWQSAFYSGVTLGIAQLSKTSWLVLFVTFPVIWLFSSRNSSLTNELRCKPLDVRSRNRGKVNRFDGVGISYNRLVSACGQSTILQLFFILFVPLFLINFCYGFDGLGVPLNQYNFVSTAFTGNEKSGDYGNRFRGTLVDSCPVPLPKQYLLGIDSQWKDFEFVGAWSYLRGTYRSVGWWYYYLYGVLVKAPAGALIILSWALAQRLLCGRWMEFPHNELAILAPAGGLFVLVSSQREFNIHLRYIFPSLGLCYVFAGQVMGRTGVASPLRCAAVSALLCHAVTGTIQCYPHHLAYFNEFVGGSRQGHRHLLGSSYDWGQDVMYVADLLYRKNPSDRVFFIGDGLFDVTSLFPRIRGPQPDSVGRLVTEGAQSEFESGDVLLIGYTRPAGISRDLQSTHDLAEFLVDQGFASDYIHLPNGCPHRVLVLDFTEREKKLRPNSECTQFEASECTPTQYLRINHMGK